MSLSGMSRDRRGWRLELCVELRAKKLADKIDKKQLVG